MSNNLSHGTDATQLENTELTDLAAILGSFKRHWLVLLACIIVATMAAIALKFTIAPQWQASATIQIGQLPINPTTLIEPTAQAAERFKQRQLQDYALTAVGLPLNEESDARTGLFRKTLKATPGKNTDFVDVNVAGLSQEEAKNSLNAAVQALVSVHNVRLAPMVKNLNDRLEANTREMLQATTEKARMEASLKNATSTPAGARFEPSVVAINVLAKQDEQIRNLTNEQAALMDLRTKTDSFPTMLVDAIYVPVKPYFPKLSIFLAIGLILGAIAGAAIAIFLDRNRPKASS
ncbi:Chain length determinant protein [Collimonas sp. OK307]|uniref:Wzz/FepE/Etk N-terminal domain-containing protein n=1 Tax=Collimonas sp. OK307 TaxID=1801620 RepID=UPI0008E63D59|nr:Wzz/FepE/Etk N-terminal domain-containing protein [Collimonas sp. OK307]SFH80844.1 Chain length determinant protein [Collimonas sp. OK307]